MKVSDIQMSILDGNPNMSPMTSQFCTMFYVRHAYRIADVLINFMKCETVFELLARGTTYHSYNDSLAMVSFDEDVASL
jgi:hypothetical protein